MARAFEHLGRDRGDFVGYRVAVPYPPIPTKLFLNCVLPTR